MGSNAHARPCVACTSFQSQKGSHWAFISACPDVGQKKENCSLKAVVKHQIWSQTITQTHVTLYKKFIIKKELSNEDEICSKEKSSHTGSKILIEHICCYRRNTSPACVKVPPLKRPYICSQRNLLKGNSSTLIREVT